MLAVMEALAEDEEATQRERSCRSGLHLKKVNYCLHKLLEKGRAAVGVRAREGAEYEIIEKESIRLE